MLQSVFSVPISAVGNERLILIRDLGIFASVALTLYVVWFNFLYVPRPSTPGTDQSPPELQLSASQTAQSFFEKQFDFINDGFKATSSSIYQLTLFGRKAIVLSGTEARQVFTKEKGLNIYDSFSILLGSVRCYIPYIYTILELATNLPEEQCSVQPPPGQCYHQAHGSDATA